MTEIKLQKLVDQAVVLDRAIQEQTEALKEMKRQLVFESETRTEAHEPTEGGGWSLVLGGTNGCIARIIQPGPRLKSTIDAEKTAGAKIMEYVGKFKDSLFSPLLRYEPVMNFRARCEELLTPRVANAVIKACETQSSISVSFETKEIA